MVTRYLGVPGCHCLICRRSNAMTSTIRVPQPLPARVYAIEITPPNPPTFPTNVTAIVPV